MVFWGAKMGGIRRGDKGGRMGGRGILRGLLAEKILRDIACVLRVLGLYSVSGLEGFSFRSAG